MAAWLTADRVASYVKIWTRESTGQRTWQRLGYRADRESFRSDLNRLPEILPLGPEACRPRIIRASSALA
jgi:hypothetical protein